VSIQTFVRRVQRNLLLATIVSVIAIVAGIVFIVIAAAAFAGTKSSLPFVIAALLSLAFVILAAWRVRTVRSPRHTALWIEELDPSLQYAVVTANEPDYSSPELEKSVRLDTLQPIVTRRIIRTLARGFGFAVFAFAIYLISPATSFGRVRIHGGLARVFPGAVSPVDKLARLRARVLPPAYSRIEPFERTDPTSLLTLTGSIISLSGDGSAEGVSVTLDNAPIRVSGNGDSWTARVTTSKAASVLRATYGARSRMIVIETYPDNPPRVTLVAPIRDTILRSANYSVVLRATTSDDIGLSTGYFEYLIVSGSGEAFTGRTVSSNPVHFNSRAGTMETRLNFSAYKIGPGDLISIRAIARDNNSLTGPSLGTSDTRTFRVARTDEYDSVSIEAAAPPPVDSSAMSQRMLIIMTEALVKKQKTLTRQQLVKQSDDIGFMEDRIRKRVYDILYQTDSPEGAGDTEEVESEMQAINNPDLKQAYDALWDAVRSLRIAEPAVALPPMRIALKALDRARLAKRLYLRGAAPKIVVDVGHVRLTGKEHGGSSVRTPQFVSDSSRRFFARELQSALEMRATNPQRMLETLSLLRVRAIQSEPAFASELAKAIDLLEHHRPANEALGRARKALDPSRLTVSPAEWGGG
jgi:hypothetical protein